MLHSQAQILARQGVILERSTLSFWMGYAAAEVAPVVARLREMMLASTRIFADETVVPVLDPGRGRTKQGYFWAMARDDRPWGGSQPPAVVYSYAPGRGHTHANTLLGGYRGILQCDGYAAYKKFAGSKSAETSVTLAFCWSHVRRGFYDLAKAKAPIATETLQRIAALYEIEARVRGKSAADRLAVRQTESKPLVTELRNWFEAQIAKLPARGPTADAIRYALNHWDGLCRFLDDGRIELDNNSVERSMRPVALSRKNSLFAGSVLAQGHQLGTIVGRKGWRLLGLAEVVELHLQIAQLCQLLVPTPLQLAGNQAIVRIDGVVLAACPSGFVLCLLDSVLDLLALVALALIVGLHRGKRGLDPERLESVEGFLRDGSIDPHAAESDAVISRFGAERAAADIPLSIAALAGVLNM